MKNFFLKDGEYTGSINEPAQRGDMSYLAEEMSGMIMKLPLVERKAVSMVVMQICEVFAGDEYMTGLDGTTVTLEKLEVFLNKDMAKILYALLASESGRKILVEQGTAFISDRFRENPWEAVALLYGIVIATPVLIYVVSNIGSYVSLILTGTEILKRLGADFQAAAGFFERALERIEAFCSGMDDWIHGRGFGADYSRFQFSEAAANDTLEELARQSAELENIAQQVRNIKDQIDFGLLTSYAFSIRLARCAREIDRNANTAVRMEKALGDGRDVYLQNEKRIVRKYAIYCK